MAPFESKSKKSTKQLRDNKLLEAALYSSISQANLKDFLNIERLDLSNKKLSNLPDDFKCLNKLKFLNLSGNYFEKLPNCFTQGLVLLEQLDLSRNLLKEFIVPEKSSFKSLECLNLNSNKLGSIPEWVLTWNCSPLKVLNLSYNQCLKNVIGTCFFEKFHLAHLMKRSVSKTVKNLTVSNCGLTLSNSILLLAFDSVEQLNLSNCCSNQSNSYNYLPQLPCASMERMERLTVLNVANVSLITLNESIVQFSNLRVLIANSNRLSWIPNCFCGLTSLEYCDLSNNRIFELPKNIEKLQCLHVLLLAFNRLRCVPENLQKLESLQELDLYMNDVSDPPTELHGSNLIGLDLERNVFDTRTMKLRNADYANLRDAYREKYKLVREKGKTVFEKHNSSRSCSGSSGSSGKPESDVLNDMINISIEPFCSMEENWDEETNHDTSLDEFNPNVHGLDMGRGCFVWRHRLWFGDLWKPLQCRMFGNMRCQNKLDTVIRADIPETRSNCFMANDWITEDYAEYKPFVIHPHCIVYEDEVRKWREIAPVEGQFDDADE